MAFLLASRFSTERGTKLLTGADHRCGICCRVDKSIDGPRPNAATSLIGLWASRCTHKGRGVCQEGSIHTIHDGDERARLLDGEMQVRDTGKVELTIVALGKGSGRGRKYCDQRYVSEECRPNYTPPPETDRNCIPCRTQQREHARTPYEERVIKIKSCIISAPRLVLERTIRVRPALNSLSVMF